MRRQEGFWWGRRRGGHPWGISLFSDGTASDVNTYKDLTGDYEMGPFLGKEPGAVVKILASVERALAAYDGSDGAPGQAGLDLAEAVRLAIHGTPSVEKVG